MICRKGCLYLDTFRKQQISWTERGDIFSVGVSSKSLTADFHLEGVFLRHIQIPRVMFLNPCYMSASWERAELEKIKVRTLEFLPQFSGLQMEIFVVKVCKMYLYLFKKLSEVFQLRRLSHCSQAS